MSAIWNKPAQVYLSFLVGLQLIPLFWVVPIWVSATALLLVGWKLAHLFRGIALPSMRWVWLIGFWGIGLIFFTKKTLIGEDAATAVLALMAGCKLIESTRYRDIMITVTLCFLLLMVNLLVSQGLGTMAYLVIDVMLLVQLLLQLHPSNVSLFSFRVVGRLLLVVLPVWALLFFAFPRFTIGFWQREIPMARAGFSDELNPGLVSRVAESDEIALRAQIDDSDIRPDDLYWRGAILSVSDGLHWSKSSRSFQSERVASEAGKKRRYRVWLEPMFKRWLFTLDYTDPNERIHITNNTAYHRSGFYLEAQRNVISRTLYSGTATSEAPVQIGLSPIEKASFLQLPKNLEPEIRALAERLKSKQKGRAGIAESLENIERYFRSENFRYTLTPGPVPGNRLSGFLFQSKVGFCEHYAAAGAVLLRAMQIPARVVVGFQGAERNPLGDYWMIRNKNAHAWSEAWIESADGSGQWRRFDLVSVITPTRMAMGSRFFQPGATLTGESEDRQSWLARARTRAQLLVDAVEMQWVRFLVSYDFEYQQNLISRFGVQNASRLTFFVIVAVGIGSFLAVLMWLLQRRGRVSDPILEEWRRFCEKLRQAGVERFPNEGPMNFIQRATSEKPELSQQLNEVGAMYVQLRYQRNGSSSTLFQAFRKKVDQFKIHSSF